MLAVGRTCILKVGWACKEMWTVIRNDARGPVLCKSHKLSQTVSQLIIDELGYFSEEIAKQSTKCLFFVFFFLMIIVKYKRKERETER